jgi:hypothetical protein
VYCPTVEYIRPRGHPFRTIDPICLATHSNSLCSQFRELSCNLIHQAYSPGRRVLRISKRPEPVNIVHCPSCIWHEPFCYSRRRRPTPKKHLEGQPRVCGRTQNTDTRGLFPSRRRIPFGVSPFPGPCCKREKEEKEKEKDTKSNDVAYLFFDAVIMAKAKRRPLLLPKCRLSRCRVNATGRVVRGAAVARVRAVRGTEHGRAVFTPWERVPLLSLDGT